MTRSKTTREVKVLRVALIFALILGSIVGLWALQMSTAKDKDQAVTEKQEVENVARPLAQQVLELCATGGKAAQELINEGVCPTAQDAAEVVGITGPRGPAGAQGPPPSDEQVLRAVTSFCTDTGACRGSDGRSVTAAQVAAAVASYCNANGECRGPTGSSGVDGIDGVDGADGATGPQGPPPTAEQIAAAVDAYCGGGACQGPAGPKGEPGAPGTIITSFECTETDAGVMLTLSFSDNPSQSVSLRLDDVLTGSLNCS